ncbi:MAG: sporadic carbohydrate cluster protein, LIC12192 family [Gammaproteobacteria bacterium]|nr:sporadic carbohydrate cluster protein, LIC12192 family [Gammaproteobacteria bacterium]
MSKHQTLGYRGYIGSRPYAGGEFPQSVQNMLIRNFCQKNKLHFLLSATEYTMPGCYMMLQEVVNSMDSLSGIVLFSLDMLPDKKTVRMAIYNKLLPCEKTLHFALEDMSVSTWDDIEYIENIIQLNKIAVTEKMMREFYAISDVREEVVFG